MGMGMGMGMEIRKGIGIRMEIRLGEDWKWREKECRDTIALFYSTARGGSSPDIFGT
jgi:hypothetical protein